MTASPISYVYARQTPALRTRYAAFVSRSGVANDDSNLQVDLGLAERNGDAKNPTHEAR
jgi:hypothetical protein